MHLVCPSPSGWYPEVKWSFMSKALPRVWKKDETNSVPWSEVTCDGTLCLEKTWSTNNLASNILTVGTKINGLLGDQLKDGVKTRGWRELLDKVHGNQIPELFQNWEWL